MVRLAHQTVCACAAADALSRYVGDRDRQGAIEKEPILVGRPDREVRGPEGIRGEFKNIKTSVPGC